MNRLVPDFIQEQYANNKATGSFDACALFVDVSGFTVITDALMGHGQHGAEILANIIQDVFDPLMESVFEQGGFVTNLAGDAFTAVFPADDKITGASERGLAAAWKMQHIMASSVEHQTPYGAFSMSVKVGVAAGEVAWGIISSPDKKRAVYYFQGEAIDSCAEAQKAAGPGELLVDAAVFDSLETNISAEPAGDYFRIREINSDPPAPLPIDLKPIEPGILHCFFPPEATQENLSGEFRQVVNMFVSLPTVRTEEQLEMFMQIIFELQDKYGGLLNRLDFGDKGANVPLFWGAPVAHENDVARALNFILDLQSQTVIPVNAGITYGTSHGGYSGGALAGEYTCHGRGTTLAARFMQSSPRGEIWVDENVAARGARHFEIEFEEKMAFKGFAKEQRVFVLLERKDEIDAFYQSPMVGRQNDQGRLVDFVQPIFSSSYPGIMVVWGEPGIGKSRLIHGFLQHLEQVVEETFSVFICQTDEIFRESLNPFRYWLRRYFSQSEQQSDARNKRSFNRKLDRLIGHTQDSHLRAELDRTRSLLGALVNLSWPDSLYEQLEAQGRYKNSLTGLATLLMAESQQQPVILLLEDGHWLDGDSKLFLQQLNQLLVQDQKCPVAILVTARTEGHRAILGNDVIFDEINLDQMSADDQATLAADQLGSPIGSGLLALLVDRAEGNPFFSEQILRYLLEQELIYLAGGEWRLKEYQDAALPTDVRAVLVARLDRLTQDVKEVVQTASVLGREFEIQLLSHMLLDDPLVEKMVEQAEQMSIWSALTELRYLFKHTLLRDAAYRMQIRSRRESLHKLAAEALEALHAEDLAHHYGELAYHTEQAKQIDKARRYLDLAGNTAKDFYQNSTALEYYTRALELTPDDDLESRFELLASRVTVYARISNDKDQAGDLDEMMELAIRMADSAKQVRVLIDRAWMHWWMADYDTSLVAAQHATSMAEEADEYELVARADIVSTWIMIEQGDYDSARSLAEKALFSARQSADKNLEANALHGLGFVYRVEGDYYSSLQAAERALAINRSAGNRDREGTALGNLGVAYMSLGNYVAARDSFLQAQAIGRETGSRSRVGSATINLMWHAQAIGDWETAVAHGEDAINLLRDAKQIEMIAEGLIWLGHARFGLGQIEEAFIAYDESLRLRRQLAQDYLAMGVLAGMARAAVATDDLDSAINYVAEIMAYLDGGGSLDSTWEPLRLYLTCYQVLNLAGDARGDEVLLIAYQKLQRWAGMIPDAATRRMYLENVPWHAKIVSIYRTGNIRGA